MGIPYAEVIGDPISHSKSPLIHKFWLDKLGIEGEYRSTRVPSADLPAFLDNRRRDENWRGCNVTMPHKAAVLPFIDELDPEAALVGAANTILQAPRNRLIGLNTDGIGFIDPLHSFSPILKTATVVGAGGAARAVLLALREMNVSRLSLINRNQARSLEVAQDFPEIRTIGVLCDGLKIEATDILINATPLGMVGFPPVSLDLAELHQNAIVYDLVYTPHETALLSDAKARGLVTIGGLEMLVGQAAFAFTYFYRRPAPREHDAKLFEVLTQ